ncbi:hypothetical protein BCR35DRAFT_301266 [Leucosporidium creatinivorum]|uniref:MYND-type domain-containing protein n=1 Tax=Leucosporidium creatinivorum TaxID=106004 RepID=A0A1Y2FZV8_9BASI|nr:hypothetical protein BCR35DRAFT_301266 [Leucosporidium creatinivorum]
MPPPCFVCSLPAATRCSRCKETPYCSSSCQMKDWNRHKLACVRAAPRAAASSTAADEREENGGRAESSADRWQIAGAVTEAGFREGALTAGFHDASGFCAMLLSEGDPDMLDDMMVTRDGMVGVYQPPTGDSPLDTLRNITRLYWQGTVASLNAEGREQLRARLRSCPSYGAFKGFTGEEVVEPARVSNTTLDTFCGMLLPLDLLPGLVDNKLVVTWRELAVIKMKLCV